MFLTFLACLLLGAFGHIRRATADPTRVRVRGTSRIDAHAGRSAGKLVLSGTVTDDAASTLPRFRLGIWLTSEEFASRAVAAVPLSRAAAEGCTEGGAVPVVETAERISVATDEGGRFCVRLSLPNQRYVAHLEASPSLLVDGSRLEVPIDLALRPVSLRLEGSRDLSLDDPSATLRAQASVEDDEVVAPELGGLRLTLFTEEGIVVADATTDATGRASFAVPTAKLGPPGHGELRLSFAGNSLIAPSTSSMTVDRVTRVSLRAPRAPGGRLPPASPAEGSTIAIDGTLGCAVRGCSGWPSGSVEARVSDVVVGAAPLNRGHADLRVVFADPAEPEALLKLVYVPNSPWLRAGSEVTLILPIKAAARWGRGPLVLGGLGALAWLILTRIPIGRPRRSGGDARAPGNDVAAGLIFEPVPSIRGWAGRVVDAHETTPIPLARLTVERPGFETPTVVAQTTADASGAFAIASLATRPGDELVVESAFHSPLRRPMPPEGKLQIALRSRKRALLESLVAWARRRGRPFDAMVDPTPGEIRRAARDEELVTRWAEAVEKAAYAGEVVDAEAQASVEDLAPDKTAPGR